MPLCHASVPLCHLEILDLSGEFVPGIVRLSRAGRRRVRRPRARARQRGITFLRPRTTSVGVGLGADSCTQVFLNILDNAVRYGREGGHIRIAWSVRLPSAGIRVDDGPGVGCARRPGRGIGLTMERTIVERAGGDVRASRSPLGGARFELRLPVRADSATLVS